MKNLVHNKCFLPLVLLIFLMWGCATPGMNYIKSGDVDRAIEETLRAIPNTSESLLPGRYHNLGYLYTEKGELDLALMYYKKELHFSSSREKEIGMMRGYTGLSEVLYLQGNYDESYEYAKKALSYDLPFTDAWKASTHAILGMIYLRHNKKSESSEEFQKTLSLCPDCVSDAFERSKILLAKGYKTGALIQLHAAMSVDEKYFEKIMETPELASLFEEADDLKAPKVIYESFARLRSNTEKMALLSDLISDARFDDSNSIIPNKRLDAGEEASLIVTIKNRGKGPGYGVNLNISTDSSYVKFEGRQDIGEIAPDKEKEIAIPVNARIDTPDSKLPFLIEAKEKRGYDARKVVMNIDTAKLVKPDLKIELVEINDGNIGIAKGNGNGIIENDETIELTVYIKNQGQGQAVGVNLDGGKLNREIDWINNTANIGTISPGETAKARLAFSVPRKSDAKEILADLKATDIRGVSNSQKKVSYAISTQRPDIHYAYKIISRKGSVVNSITNGEEYDLELSIENRGRISARDVALEFKPSPGVSISTAQITIDEITGGATPQIRRLTLGTGRTYDLKEASLDLVISQADFGSSKTSVSIPVDLRGPKLRYIASLRSRNGAGAIEQGESADLEIFAVNDGNMVAEDIWVNIKSTDVNFRIPQSQEKKLIGTIPAGSKSDSMKFKVHALRALKPGDVFIDINLTQKDFPSVSSQYAVNVAEEAATIINVSQERNAASKTGSPAKQFGPSINIKSTINRAIIDEEIFPLFFSVEDSRNLDKVYVTVNNIKKHEQRPASKSVTISESITLEPGENRIAITAFNSNGERERKEFVITRVQEDMHNPPVTGVSNPDAYAVVIGNQAYKNIKNVDYAVNDARLVKKHLVNVLGFKEGNIFFVENATQSDFRTLFGTEKNPKGRLYDQIKPGKSDVFVFYSGHGAPGLQDKKGYFVPVEADQQNIQFVGYPLDLFYDNLSKIPARSVTVVADACFSGADIYENISPLFIEIKNPLISLNKGVVLSSSSGSQVSSWYNEKKQGLFTYFFLKAIRNNNADYNGDNKVTFDEIYRYISDNSEGVPYYARKLHGIEQTPTIEGDYEERVLFKYLR